MAPLRVEEHSAEDDEPEEQGEGDPFRISTRLKERYRILLAATQAGWKRGTISVLKCRLCPGAGFRNWERAQRVQHVGEALPGDQRGPRDAVFTDHQADVSRVVEKGSREQC